MYFRSNMIFFLIRPPSPSIFFFFFFNDTATTEIYTLSLHDALPICIVSGIGSLTQIGAGTTILTGSNIYTGGTTLRDRKSTRLNSSHSQISYAVFCLKKKKIETKSILYIRRQQYTDPLSPCLRSTVY